MFVFTLAVCLCGGAGIRAQRIEASLTRTLQRAGAYVAEYYARAQRIVATETVVIQNVGRDLSSEGFPRRYVYGLHVEWVPSDSGEPEASLARELLTVNGRPAKADDEPHCAAPAVVTPEPLEMFLPGRQEEYVFARPEPAELDGRPVVRLDFRVREPGPDQISWDRECVSMLFPSRLRGRAWVDPETGEVLRLDEGSNGPVDIRAPRERVRQGFRERSVFNRSLVSIRYRPVTFSDPEETILLPASIEALAMDDRGGTRRVQTYTDYRRFVTEGRIVE